MSFKQFFTESTVPVFNLEGYGKPGPRCKFQEGETVIVRQPKMGGYDRAPFASHGVGKNKVLGMHPKKAAPYLNKIGTVVGYRNVPGAYSKFAVKFLDGAIIPIHSHYLFDRKHDQELDTILSLKPETLETFKDIIDEL
jgi:hypothetical protein